MKITHCFKFLVTVSCLVVFKQQFAAQTIGENHLHQYIAEIMETYRPECFNFGEDTTKRERLRKRLQDDLQIIASETNTEKVKTGFLARLKSKGSKRISHCFKNPHVTVDAKGRTPLHRVLTDIANRNQRILLLETLLAHAQREGVTHEEIKNAAGQTLLDVAIADELAIEAALITYYFFYNRAQETFDIQAVEEILTNPSLSQEFKDRYVDHLGLYKVLPLDDPFRQKLDRLLQKKPVLPARRSTGAAACHTYVNVSVAPPSRTDSPSSNGSDESMYESPRNTLETRAGRK